MHTRSYIHLDKHLCWRMAWLVQMFVAIGFYYVSLSVSAADVSGVLGLEGLSFKDESALEEQDAEGVSAFLELQYLNTWDEGQQGIVVDLFYREDADTNNRDKVDPRDLYWVRYGTTTDVFIGYRKVFWGVTEFKHLVDIVNQKDLVDDPFGNESLGQPMVSLTRVEEWGTFDLFLLAGFRERTFPGRESRLRPLVYIDTENAVYEDAKEDSRFDFAARSFHSIDVVDVAFSYFSGTAREPYLVPSQDTAGQPILTPYYGLIGQFGLEAQLLLDDWMLKFEGIDVQSRNDDPHFYSRYRAYNLGLERTIFGILETSADLGIFLEFMYDGRGARATSPFENDIFFGGRLAANDLGDTSLLVGVAYDLEHYSRVWRVVGERRFGQSVKLSVSGALFDGVEESEILFSQRNDSYIGLEVNFYFGTN